MTREQILACQSPGEVAYVAAFSGMKGRHIWAECNSVIKREWEELAADVIHFHEANK